jgi:hypothetical protein
MALSDCFREFFQHGFVPNQDRLDCRKFFLISANSFRISAIWLRLCGREVRDILLIVVIGPKRVISKFFRFAPLLIRHEADDLSFVVGAKNPGRLTHVIKTGNAAVVVSGTTFNGFRNVGIEPIASGQKIAINGSGQRSVTAGSAKTDIVWWNFESHMGIGRHVSFRS